MDKFNTELVKPLTDNSVFVNGLCKSNGRLELNTTFKQETNGKAKYWYLYPWQINADLKRRANDDGFFRTPPLADQINIMNPVAVIKMPKKVGLGF